MLIYHQCWPIVLRAEIWEPARGGRRVTVPCNWSLECVLIVVASGTSILWPPVPTRRWRLLGSQGGWP
jgi:hypothetical protein